MSRKFVIALICGSVVITLSMGTRQVFGLFLQPLTMSVDVSRDTFGLIIGLQNLVWGLTQPVAGWLADRFGAARVVLAGGLLYVAGLALASLGHSGLVLGLTIGVLVGLGQSGTSYAVVLGSIARLAPEDKRTIALSIASTAGSIGMFTLVPLTQGLISGFDWRVALMSLAALSILMSVLATGLRELSPASGRRVTSAPTWRVLRAAIGHPGFWMLNTGFAACGYQLALLATHLPAVLRDSGLPASTGAAALALIGLSNIVGTYLCGLLGARYRKKNVLATLYLARTMLFSLFVLAPPSTASALLFAVAIGLTWTGTVPLTSGLVGDIFGTRDLGLLFGIVYVGHQIGAFLGAWSGGAAFDRTGSYAPVWIAGIAMGLLAALLHVPIRDRPLAAVAPVRP